MNTSIMNNDCCRNEAIDCVQDLTVKSPQFYRAAIDVHELDDQFVIVSDMPGAEADGIEISVEDNTLEITGKVPNRYETKGRMLRQEYGIGDFHRRFRIGDGIDVSQISATCKEGVLTVKLPKSASIRSRTIEVRAE